MVSYSAGSCCYQGVKYDGQPKGTLSTLGDFEVYTSHPPNNSNHGLLILTDIIGCRLTYTQLIADQFAMHGYVVLMPEIFYGYAVPLNRTGDLDMQKWRIGGYHPQGINHLPETVDPVVETCLTVMRKLGCKKFGATRYCFGGKYFIRHLKPGRVDIGYTAHPSHVDESEIKDIECPLAIAAAKRHETEAILKGLVVNHGFTVRGDPAIPDVRFAKRSAFIQGVEWFNEHLRNEYFQVELIKRLCI
ncbi:Dienelactone hydrolase [Penicillium antarcticum]|uniref:Dienelactone hydrolase n=1 Tax=Penicillium antarcticum TaxID=416450 RepID=UPI00239D5377|nr:Dienelactone hydrolase [Penicillium antarcticum]KAJ5305990.1 Dienelactone hydrolase [Penicillium antarcticum]